MLLIDTNVAIAALNESDPRVSERLDSEFASGSLIYLSTIVVFELEFGVARSARREFNRVNLSKFLAAPFVVAPFEAEDAGHAGDIRAHLKRAGTPIGPYDVLIAAQARRRGAVLVSANRRAFERVPGLRATDWAA